jgi:CRP-like cAMP-binding protein
MLRPLPMPAIDALASPVGHTELEAGEAVFRHGDRGDRFYVIADGQAEVIGDGRLIRTMGPGEGFGEIALLHTTVRTTTVCARTPLRLRTLERRHFMAALSGYQSSAREADTVMRNRLATFDPRAPLARAGAGSPPRDPAGTSRGWSSPAPRSDLVLPARFAR